MSDGTYRRLALLFIATLLLASCQRKIDRRRIYRIGIRSLASSPADPADSRDALAVEVASEAARRAGIHLQWAELPQGPDEAFQSKRVDLWPLLTVLPERAPQFHLTEPWMTSERAMVSAVTHDRDPARTSWGGSRVAYGAGPPRLLTTYFPGAIPLQKHGEMAAIQSVCTGEADAAFVFLQSLGSLLVKRPPGCETVVFHITPLRATQLKTALASTFETAAVADALREKIGQMAADGSLASLFNKYSMYSSFESEIVYQLTDAERRSRWSAYGVVVLALVSASLLLLMRRVRTARRAADRANRAKSEFLARMSHEIRTPLNGILATAEMLARLKLDNDQRSLVELMQASSEGLMTLVDEILDFSKIEIGGLRTEPADFDLYEVVQQTVRLLAPRAAAKGLTLESEIGPEVPRWVNTDPQRLRQILMNLLSNALKFTEAGHIRIELGPGGDPADCLAVLFRVIDTGIGIDPPTIQKLFTPFTQADSASTRKYGGAGLGLAVSRRLVSLLGGSMGVDSRPGCGSTFWFLVPIHRAQPPAPPQPEIAPSVTTCPPLLPDAPVSSGHLLIVDDNPVNQIVALRAARSLGYSAEVVAGGYEALKALIRERFDLVLLDCQMPDLDGYDTAIEIRKREASAPLGICRTPIVAMTANAFEGELERCLAAGMDDYLAKPFRLAALDRTLARWVRRPDPNQPEQAMAVSASSVAASPTPPNRPSDPSPIPLRTQLPRG